MINRSEQATKTYLVLSAYVAVDPRKRTLPELLEVAAAARWLTVKDIGQALIDIDLPAALPFECLVAELDSLCTLAEAFWAAAAENFPIGLLMSEVAQAWTAYSSVIISRS
jgi:hypothetical protein